MNGTNYIAGMVRILEAPIQKNLKDNHFVTKVRAQLPQRKNTRIVRLKVWGNLARDLTTYYKKNDYILIEGYVRVRTKKPVDSTPWKRKRIEILVLKLYPVRPSSTLSVPQS